MPITDLFTASRRILRKLFGRTRPVALAAALVPLGAVGLSSAKAAPEPPLPPGFPATPFSIRVTDMERIASDSEQDAFRVELEVLNWTSRYAAGLRMSANVGTSAVDGTAPFMVGASIDADGRGGAPGGADIGTGVFDPVAIHSGHGRGDVPGMRNDWIVASKGPTSVEWRNFEGTVENPTNVAPGINGKWISYSGGGSPYLDAVPGFGVDALGDSAMDGGPAPYSPPSPGGGEPDQDWERNSVDGFVLDIDDWDQGEVFSMNWFLAGLCCGSGGYPDQYYAIGSHNQGDPFGFGVMNLVRLEPTIGAPAGVLPGPVFIGNEGFDQSGISFYDTVYEVPNPAEFAAEFGGGITAHFLNQADNVFGAAINTHLIVPEPGATLLVGIGLVGLAVGGTRRRESD
jgi:hypothetical protein